MQDPWYLYLYTEEKIVHKQINKYLFLEWGCYSPPVYFSSRVLTVVHPHVVHFTPFKAGLSLNGGDEISGSFQFWIPSALGQLLLIVLFSSISFLPSILLILTRVCTQVRGKHCVVFCVFYHSFIYSSRTSLSLFFFSLRCAAWRILVP